MTRFIHVLLQSILSNFGTEGPMEVTKSKRKRTVERQLDARIQLKTLEKKCFNIEKNTTDCTFRHIRSVKLPVQGTKPVEDTSFYTTNFRLKGAAG